MRIAIVTPEFPPHAGGGILKYYDVLADALVAAGASVTVLVATPFSAHQDYTTSSGVEVRFVPLADVERHAARLTHLAAAPMFRRWIGASLAAAEAAQPLLEGVDAIEAADFGLGFAALLGLAERPPMLIRMHGSLGQLTEHEPVSAREELDAVLSRTSEATLLPAAERLVAYSPANAAEWAARLGLGVGFIPPPLSLPMPLKPESADYTGLVVARIQAWKGPELLCRALAALGDQVPSDLKIAWAGRDTATAPDGRSLSDWLARTYPRIWGTRVVPIGQQPATVIARLQASVRYAVVPSLWDTFNYTLAEAMGAGAVVVSSTGAGGSYLIESGSNGFTFAVDDVTAFGQALVEAHALSPAQRNAAGTAARDTIACALHPPTIASRTLAELRSLSLARERRPGPWVREFFDPAPAAGGSATAFLENVSIRDLARHLGTRIIRKIAV